MGKGIEPFIYLILLWVFPAFMVVRGYLKMTPEEQKSAISEFKSKRLFPSLALFTIGGFLVHAGVLFNMRAIELIGFSLFITGGIFTVISMWKDSKVRSVSILVLIFLGTFLYMVW